jgi:16S rRNA G966 N2-methylase RsmD
VLVQQPFLAHARARARKGCLTDHVVFLDPPYHSVFLNPIERQRRQITYLVPSSYPFTTMVRHISRKAKTISYEPGLPTSIELQHVNR